jgi:predicted nucleic acid-binding protein
VTLYLVDVHVLQQMKPGGDPAVLAWKSTVDDSDLRNSAFTTFEMRRGRVAERNRAMSKGQEAHEFDAKIAKLDAFIAEFADRLIPVDGETVIEWTELLGAKGNNAIDAALAATARVHNLVVVTQNEKDFVGRGVRLLNPFKWPCDIKEV